MHKIDRKYRLARIWSNKELKKITPLCTGQVINVSAGQNIDKEGRTYDTYFTNASEFWISNYSPGSYRGYEGRKNEILIDLEKPLNESLHHSFDVVFNHTTLEHVFDVFTAFDNLCLLSKDLVVIVVPFAQEQHENEGYKDYWRFTPTVLHKLFERNGLSVVYESANNDFNAASYIFMVGAREPEKWNEKMPSYTPIKVAASWIGDENKKGGNSFISRLWSKIV